VPRREELPEKASTDAAVELRPPPPEDPIGKVATVM
jgi:hypothetical protein